MVNPGDIPMKVNQSHTVSSALVAESERLNFLPKYFSIPLMIRGEKLVYKWFRNLSKDYKGGYWNFYEISNGGFYIAPIQEGQLLLSCENGFEDHLTANAAGIVATLYSLGQLANESKNDNIIDMYHRLLEYLDGHPEGNKIYQAID